MGLGNSGAQARENVIHFYLLKLELGALSEHPVAAEGTSITTDASAPAPNVLGHTVGAVSLSPNLTVVALKSAIRDTLSHKIGSHPAEDLVLKLGSLAQPEQGTLLTDEQAISEVVA